MTPLDCLRQTGLNLDAAVLLAEACRVAYESFEKGGKPWAATQGFQSSAGCDEGNTQMFWAETNDIALLVFRGTSNIGQWVRDARILPAFHPWGLVHRGFKTGVSVVADALAAFTAVAKARKCVWITGHSLGGALAALVAANLRQEGIVPMVYTYGQPRLGYWNFSDRFDNELTGRNYRFINQSDIVARLPPGLLFKHSAIPKRILKPGVLEAAGEELPFSSIMPDAAYAPRTRSLLESAESPISVGVHPKLVDSDIPPISEREFLMLQLELGTASDTYDEKRELEGGIDLEGIFADHGISHYVELLAQIRDGLSNPNATGHEPKQ